MVSISPLMVSNAGSCTTVGYPLRSYGEKPGKVPPFEMLNGELLGVIDVIEIPLGILSERTSGELGSV